MIKEANVCTTSEVKYLYKWCVWWLSRMKCGWFGSCLKVCFQCFSSCRSMDEGPCWWDKRLWIRLAESCVIINDGSEFGLMKPTEGHPDRNHISSSCLVLINLLAHIVSFIAPLVSVHVLAPSPTRHPVFEWALYAWIESWNRSVSSKCPALWAFCRLPGRVGDFIGVWLKIRVNFPIKVFCSPPSCLAAAHVLIPSQLFLFFVLDSRGRWYYSWQ